MTAQLEDRIRKALLLAYADGAANGKRDDPMPFIDDLLKTCAIPEPERHHVFLNGYQLKEIMETFYPEGTAEQMDDEVGIDVGTIVEDDGSERVGLRCWSADYPDEGCFPLDNIEPPAPEVKP